MLPALHLGAGRDRAGVESLRLRVRVARFKCCPALTAPSAPRSRYQLCLFCYQRLQNEFNNLCPGCRTPYDSDFEAGLRRRQEKVEREQHEAAAQQQQQQLGAPPGAGGGAHPPAPVSAAKAAGRKRGGQVHAQAHAQQQASSREPERDLHIEEEQAWPSLGSAAATAALPAGAAAGGRRRPLPPVATGRAEAADSASGSGSTSSGTTTATTPQSPADSVVAYRAAPPAAALCVQTLQGQCHVALQSGGLGAEPDAEGAELCASLQEAVRSGTIGIKQATASLASYLRRKHQPGGCCPPQPQLLPTGGALWCCGPQQAGSPFYASSASTDGGAAGATALLALQGRAGPAEHSLPAAPNGEPSLGGWAAATPQAGSPGAEAGSPVRRAGKLPLYARNATGGGGFPGFPAAQAKAADGGAGKAQKRMPPPGFGATAAFHALPRFAQAS
eukprot:scaffold3.g6584.t1